MHYKFNLTWDYKSDLQGCETVVYLSVAKEIGLADSGKFYQFRRVSQRLNSRLSDKMASQLWEISEELVRLKEE